MSRNRINIIISAKDDASKSIRGLSGELDTASDAGARFKQAMSTAGKYALVAAGAIATGLTAAAKASFDQVKAVEEARFGLLAYEKDAGKVNRVLSDLVAYAQSDMGVLFNRKDMFAAASTLKMYGNETGTLTERVKILSKGVSQGKTTFQELSAIVGRAAAKGKLDAVDFDMLIERGIGLNRSFRGADVSAQKLWAALDKALPDKLLADRANTIEGRMIRLQSAFRGVGDRILGVDSATSNFIENGLGDRIQKAVMGTTDVLRRMQPIVGNLTNQFLGTADRLRAALTPNISKLGSVITGDLVPAIKKFINSDFARILGTSFVVAVNSAVWAVTGFLRVLSSFISQTSQSTGILVGLTAGIVAYKVVVGTITAATTAWAVAQALLNTAMKMNPIGLVIAGAIGIGAAYVTAASQTDRNTEATDRLKAARVRLKDATNQATDAENLLMGAQMDAEGASLRVEQAQRMYNEALAQHGPKSLEARQAAYELKRAQNDLAAANDNVRKKADEAAKSQRELAKVRDEVVAANNAVANSAQNAANKYGSLADRVNAAAKAHRDNDMKAVVDSTFGVPVPGSSGAGLNIPRRSIGTNFSQGGATLVGEHGAEVVNLPAGSRVSPAWKTRSEGSPEGAGGVTNILSGNFTFETKEAAEAFWNRIDKTQRLAKWGMAA